MIGGLTGELFAGSTRVGEGGLGYAIIYANNQMETSYLFALVFAATVLGFAFFFIVMFFEWLALHNWHESSRAAHGGIGRSRTDVAHGVGDGLVADSRILITRDLAGAFAAAWGNAEFRKPEPRARVLHGIAQPR